VDSNEIKKRPALVLIDTEGEDLIVSRITSQLSKSKFDVEIFNWQKAGLLLPSFVRLHKIATIEKNLIDKVLGKLDKNDRLNVRKKINTLWKFNYEV
jgi:mRNA interferase MazF